MLIGLRQSYYQYFDSARQLVRADPSVIERKDRSQHYWYFRYREDELLPDGRIIVPRKFHTIGPSRGEGALTKKQAEVERDKFLLEKNVASSRCAAAVTALFER